MGPVYNVRRACFIAGGSPEQEGPVPSAGEKQGSMTVK